MRLCMVNPYFHPYMGGIERRIYETGKRLAKRHEVYVVTGQLPGTPEREELDGMKIERLPSGLLKIYNPPFIISKGLRKRIESIDPDIVDFHYRWALDYTISMAKVAKKYPCVFTFHNTFGEGSRLQQPLSKVNDTFFMRRLKRYRHVICVSQFVKDDLVKHGLKENMASVIYNGIDPVDKEGSTDIANEPGSTEEGYALFMGRIVKTKGLRYLLDAIEILKGRNADIKIKIAGDGPKLPSLKKQAKKGNILDAVEFLGRVSDEEKERLLAGCKMFVLPSTFESFGIVLLEAMRWGKPVVASRTGGVPEVVGDAGILVEPKDGQALASAIARMWDDDSFRKEAGGRALARMEHFSWDDISLQLEQTYENILSR